MTWKWPFARHRTHAHLWQWDGLRMSALAMVTVQVIALGMWLRSSTTTWFPMPSSSTTWSNRPGS
ncbi:hypothetical protein E4A48_06645 [Xanthomonas cerealis pv. cerealis]|uniref:Uncharacterized protein n=1 Tax=Xanthomonas cerealis pv. cerealis TaxID=152263 RepID=A0A514EBS4_9XANT|nr:hypothetical protein E4A48_06645 [Xanthomonas translucens pv. cerealis]